MTFIVHSSQYGIDTGPSLVLALPQMEFSAAFRRNRLYSRKKDSICASVPDISQMSVGFKSKVDSRYAGDQNRMPEYLNFKSKLADLNEHDAEQQLKVQLDRLLEALELLEENDRVEPSMLEQVVSV